MFPECNGCSRGNEKILNTSMSRLFSGSGFVNPGGSPWISTIFQILDFVMAGRRIVRLSETLDSLQIFFESSMVAHRLVENYWNRF